MNKKRKLLFFLTLIFVLGACTNLENTFSTRPQYGEDQRSHFNVEEETQFYAVGSSTISESGSAVAQMKAKEQAKRILREQISNESNLVLTSFFNEITSKNISTSNSTKRDLASLVATKLVSQAKQTNTWTDQGHEYIVLAINKNMVPETSKEVFINHIQVIITDLQNVVNQISADYKVISTKHIEDSKVKTNEKLTTPSTPIKKEDPSVIQNSNSEPDVFLEDF